jgi:hypothetical protein
MSIQREFLLLLAVMTAASTAALAQTLSTSTSAGGAAIPNFTGVWTHPSFPWFEPPASGPSPLVNLSRNSQGVSNYDQMVGDYKNPILQPWAAEIVKRAGQISMTDTVPNPSNQCWPNFPFLYKLQTIQLIQQPDKIMIMYSGYNNEIRRVRLNEPHLSPLKPSWYGDSIGHYEGDTLVIDTVGVKIGKYSMIDFFGTPYTDKLHIVERYKLRSWDEVKDAVARGKKDNWWFQGDVWTRNQDKMFLQAHVTIEDEGAFTTPWTGTLSYAPMDDFAESICAENRMEYYHGENSKESDVPKAEKPDF